MIKVSKQYSAYVPTFVILVVGMLSIPMFQNLNRWLEPFLWPWSPWEHWYGWITYVVVWVYAFMAWAISWIGKYIMWLSPTVSLVYLISTLRERRKIKTEGYKKLVQFHSRQLAKSWKQGKGFGYDQLSAFLNAAHLALSDGTNEKDIQIWILSGFHQVNQVADQFSKGNKFEILYPSSERNCAALPELWVNDNPCLVH